jgi:nitrogenase molybdenum-cofactor synthesis protein NifE
MGRGERRLFHAVRHIVTRYHPAAVFIYNTCVPAMEGDDLEAVCQAAQTATGVPVIAIDAAGFYGSKNLGNRLAGEVMVKRVIGQRAGPLAGDTPFAPEQRHDIGLIGEFNIAGEFWHIQPLLDELGSACSAASPAMAVSPRSRPCTGRRPICWSARGR